MYTLQLCVIQVAFSLWNWSHYAEKWGEVLGERNIVLLLRDPEFFQLDISIFPK